MRPKIVIAVLLAGVLGLAAIFFLKPGRAQTETPPIATATPTAPATQAAVAQAAPTPTNATAPVPLRLTKANPFTMGEVVGDGAEAVQAQINRLEDLQSNDDDASLQAILKELTNTNPIIRHVAIEATIQFGGHTAVPILQGLAARTWDPGEKQELLDAAEFLALPTLSEVRAEKQGAK